MEALNVVNDYDFRKQAFENLIDVLIKKYNFSYDELIYIVNGSVCRSSGEKHKYNWTKAAKDLKLNRGTLLKMRRKCGMADG